MSINYTDRIPNNVGLSDNRRLQRALGVVAAQLHEVVARDGAGRLHQLRRLSAHRHQRGDRRVGEFRIREDAGIPLGHLPGQAGTPTGLYPSADHRGEPVWQEVPGEYRAPLRRLIVTQGDTEPASVEQQRRLGLTCPSLYDLRNLFQINVEEGRDTCGPWSTCCTPTSGATGARRPRPCWNGTPATPTVPRILGAFNEATPNWMSYLMFTFFTDRDGKYQLAALAESSFDPLSRTCRFMLTEEAHHMFVGETGVMRVVQRTGEVMNELGHGRP